MLFGDAHHLGTRVLHFNLTRHEADERATYQHQAAYPDPGYQRVDEGLNHGALAIVGHAAEIDIQILVGAHADGDFRSAFLARFEQALFGLQGAQRLAVFGNLEDAAIPHVVGVVALLEAGHAQLIVADTHGVALAHFLDLALIEGVAGEADEDQHDAHVHDVAAVAARVAMGQFDGGAQQVHAGPAGDGTGAFVEFDDHGERYEQAEAERNQRIGLVYSGRSEEHTSELQSLRHL